MGTSQSHWLSLFCHSPFISWLWAVLRKVHVRQRKCSVQVNTSATCAKARLLNHLQKSGKILRTVKTAKKNTSTHPYGQSSCPSHSNFLLSSLIAHSKLLLQASLSPIKVSDSPEAFLDLQLWVRCVNTLNRIWGEPACKKEMWSMKPRHLKETYRKHGQQFKICLSSGICFYLYSMKVCKPQWKTAAYSCPPEELRRLHLPPIVWKGEEPALVSYNTGEDSVSSCQMNALLWTILHRAWGSSCSCGRFHDMLHIWIAPGSVSITV